MPYLTVDITGDGYNPHLIRFYMQHVVLFVFLLLIFLFLFEPY